MIIYRKALTIIGCTISCLFSSSVSVSAVERSAVPGIFTPSLW